MAGHWRQNGKDSQVADLAASISSLANKAGVSALLTSHSMPLPATFSFIYLGMPFDVGIRRRAEGGAELVVRGRLGNIPYTAESVAAREFVLSLVDAGRHLPMVDVNVDRNQVIVARGLMTFPSVPSPATVAAGTVAIAMAVKPLCELIIKSRDLPDEQGAP